MFEWSVSPPAVAGSPTAAANRPLEGDWTFPRRSHSSTRSLRFNSKTASEAALVVSFARENPSNAGTPDTDAADGDSRGAGDGRCSRPERSRSPRTPGPDGAWGSRLREGPSRAGAPRAAPMPRRSSALARCLPTEAGVDAVHQVGAGVHGLTNSSQEGGEPLPGGRTGRLGLLGSLGEPAETEVEHRHQQVVPRGDVPIGGRGVDSERLRQRGRGQGGPTGGCDDPSLRRVR